MIRTASEGSPPGRGVSGGRWKLIEDPEWCDAVGLVGGPFCYTDAEWDMPF